MRGAVVRRSCCARALPPTPAHAARAHPTRSQRFLKPKYARQKNKKEAVYNEAKRTRVALVEQLLRDPHLQPF